MTFDASAYLRRATGRAKSDVANKLVSMFLHEVSRKITSEFDLSVSDARYANAVAAKFGGNCCYCENTLESDRVAVEHPDGMNRFRAGLHIPGNVLLACKKCNNEKRRDDQIHHLTLASSGWESFLSHDSTKCDELCKTCAYWKSIWPDDSVRLKKLQHARLQIAEFRSDYAQFISASSGASPILRQQLELIYRDCQSFATSRISQAAEQVAATLPIQPRR